jgi:hypothetical protein
VYCKIKHFGKPHFLSISLQLFCFLKQGFVEIGLHCNIIRNSIFFSLSMFLLIFFMYLFLLPKYILDKRHNLELRSVIWCFGQSQIFLLAPVKLQGNTKYTVHTPNKKIIYFISKMKNVHAQ